MKIFGSIVIALIFLAALWTPGKVRLWYVGLWRIRMGYCPLCNSSPPRQQCVVCHGDYDYGRWVSTETRKEWLKAYDKFMEAIK